MDSIFAKGILVLLGILNALLGWGLKTMHGDIQKVETSVQTNALELSRRESIIEGAEANRRWANDFRIEMTKQLARLESTVAALENHKHK